MAVMLKVGGRKPVVSGVSTVGYGTFEVPGIVGKHIHMRTVPWNNIDEKTHTLYLDVNEAYRASITSLKYLMQYTNTRLEDIINDLKSGPV